MTVIMTVPVNSSLRMFYSTSYLACFVTHKQRVRLLQSPNIYNYRTTTHTCTKCRFNAPACCSDRGEFSVTDGVVHGRVLIACSGITYVRRRLLDVHHPSYAIVYNHRGKGRINLHHVYMVVRKCECVVLLDDSFFSSMWLGRVVDIKEATAYVMPEGAFERTTVCQCHSGWTGERCEIAEAGTATPEHGEL